MTESSSRVSAIFGALTHRRRRYALYALRETDTAISVEALAAEIAAMETTQTVPPEPLQEEIRTELVHMHLPKLQEANLIDYDRRTGDICYQNPPRLLETCLDLAAKRELSE